MLYLAKKIWVFYGDQEYRKGNGSAGTCETIARFKELL